MPQLDGNQTRESRERLLGTIDRLNDVLLEKGTELTSDQIQEIRRAIRQLNNGVVELTAKAIEGTVAALAEAVKGIQDATERANQALDTLADIRAGINVTTALVGLGIAIASGNPVGILGAAGGVVGAAGPLTARGRGRAKRA